MPLARTYGERLLVSGDAAGQVKPGGTMVYAVCSMETEENEDVVYEFLENHPDFAVETAPLTNLPAKPADLAISARVGGATDDSQIRPMITTELMPSIPNELFRM